MVWGWNSSAVPVPKGFFSVFQYSLTGKGRSGCVFGSWKTVPAVPLSALGRTQRTLPCEKCYGARSRGILLPPWFSLSVPFSWHFLPRKTSLVSHYSAIGDTILCDVPYIARQASEASFFFDTLLPRPVFGLRWTIFTERSGSVAAIVCDTTGNSRARKP